MAYISKSVLSGKERWLYTTALAAILSDVTAPSLMCSAVILLGAKVGLEELPVSWFPIHQLPFSSTWGLMPESPCALERKWGCRCHYNPCSRKVRPFLSFRFYFLSLSYEKAIQILTDCFNKCQHTFYFAFLIRICSIYLFWHWAYMCCNFCIPTFQWRSFRSLT